MKIYLLIRHTDDFDSEGRVIQAFQSQKDAKDKLDKSIKAAHIKVESGEVEPEDCESFRIQEIDLTPPSSGRAVNPVQKNGNVYFLGNKE